MDEKIHGQFTGGEVEMDPYIGGTFEVYHGYITGKNKELVPYSKIVQSWIADEINWPKTHESTVIFEFSELEGGKTLLKFSHLDVPEDMKDALEKGWYSYYWDPMRELFTTYR